MTIKTFKVAAALGLLSVAGAANAVDIVGSISPTDSFDPALTGTTSIVSQLNQLNIGAISTWQTPSGATGDLVNATNGSLFNVNFMDSYAFNLLDADGPANTGTLIYAAGGFSFYLTGVSNIVRGPLACTGTDCRDSLGFDWSGFITGPGVFTQTAFNGNWTGNGTCQGAVVAGVPTCSSQVSGSWSSSITAAGTPRVPEPGTLMLLGLGVVAMGAARRRQTVG